MPGRHAIGNRCRRFTIGNRATAAFNLNGSIGAGVCHGCPFGHTEQCTIDARARHIQCAIDRTGRLIGRLRQIHSTLVADNFNRRDDLQIDGRLPVVIDVVFKSIVTIRNHCDGRAHRLFGLIEHCRHRITYRCRIVALYQALDRTCAHCQ